MPSCSSSRGSIRRTSSPHWSAGCASAASTSANRRCTRSSCVRSGGRPMSKTFLVAQREDVENLRTKTFWIGILLFPVIIAVAAVVSRVLAESKDQRTYAVLDRTEDQWLSQEVEKRALARDLDTLLAQQRARAR